MPINEWSIIKAIGRWKSLAQSAAFANFLNLRISIDHLSFALRVRVQIRFC
jgi:hypothetical protein